MRAPSQRRALGALFSFLAVFFGGIAWTAASAGGSVLVVAVAAGAIALWLASLAVRLLRAGRVAR